MVGGVVMEDVARVCCRAPTQKPSADGPHANYAPGRSPSSLLVALAALARVTVVPPAPLSR